MCRPTYGLCALFFTNCRMDTGIVEFVATVAMEEEERLGVGPVAVRGRQVYYQLHEVLPNRLIAPRSTLFDSPHQFLEGRFLPGLSATRIASEELSPR